MTAREAIGRQDQKIKVASCSVASARTLSGRQCQNGDAGRLADTPSDRSVGWSDSNLAVPCRGQGHREQVPILRKTFLRVSLLKENAKVS
jgi:hypothetical protein